MTAKDFATDLRQYEREGAGTRLTSAECGQLAKILDSHDALVAALREAVQIEEDSNHMSEVHIDRCKIAWLPKARVALKLAEGQG